MDSCKSVVHGNIVKQKDAIKMQILHNHDLINVECKPRVVYLDPPYNSSHYGAYYSFLNYLCMYDSKQKTIGTGTLEQYTKSRFGLVKFALKEFEILFDSILADYIVMSYSSCGIINITDIVNLLCKKGNVTLNKIWYKAYKANNNSKRGHVIEYIIVVDCSRGCKGHVRKCWLKL